MLRRFQPMSLQEMRPIFEKIKANCFNDGYCWLWEGARDSSGYAQKNIQGKSRSVSRFMLCYATHTPERLDYRNYKRDACHIIGCLYHHCVNPGHLFWGDHATNCELRERERQMRPEWLNDHPEMAMWMANLYQVQQV